MQSRPAIDLTTCDREQIHLIGGVQPHGVFLAFRLNDRTVYHASTNALAMLDGAFAEPVGKTLMTLFGGPSAVLIHEAARKVTAKNPRYLRLRSVGAKLGVFEIYLFELDGLIGCEIEEVLSQDEEESASIVESYRRSQMFVEELHTSQNLIEAAGLVCSAIRSMIGFERVMMYRYLPNWDGQVIAESKSAEAQTFLDHRFPATDIPAPARELYLKNRSRLIVSSSVLAVPILPDLHYLTRKPLDLSQSKLRAVSPIHLEYLQNMKVAASFSVAVIVEGELWGLIACHGFKPKLIPHEVRLSCETVASTFAVVANMMETVTQQSAHLHFESTLRSLFYSTLSATDLVATLLSDRSSILELFRATGVAYVSSSRVRTAGLTPPERITREFADWLSAEFSRSGKSVLPIESLAAADVKWQNLLEIACGALAVKASDPDGSILILFRPQVLRTVTWGGDPRKTLAKREYQGVINPRLSFESWSETVRQCSTPWLDYEIRGAEFLRDFALGSVMRKDQLIFELGQQLKLT